MSDDDDIQFSYDPKTFPFHPDYYKWPQVSAPDVDDVLNIHCIRSEERRSFNLVGVIGADREDQISLVIAMAAKADAEVIMIKGVGLSDEICNELMAKMEECMPDEFPGLRTAIINPGWPTRFQYKVMREATDMMRHGVNFHETSLAYRLHAPVENIHYHLELLTDIGLMEAVT